LRRGDWLDDEDIFKFEKRLQAKYPHVNGLENPIIITHMPGSIIKANDFIRIVHCKRHWICVKGHEGVVEIYDSLPRSKIDKFLGNILKKIISSNFLNEITFKAVIKNVQIQKGENCGFFALAFAYALCIGLDPEEMHFDEEKIRNHYFDIIFNNKEMNMFPYTNCQRKKNNEFLNF